MDTIENENTFYRRYLFEPDVGRFMHLNRDTAIKKSVMALHLDLMDLHQRNRSPCARFCSSC